MARQYIDLGEQTFIFINGPLIFLNLTANIFYAFCLIFPPCNRQRLKHAQRAVLIWVKKNIKVVIYVALLLDGMIFLFSDAVAVASILLQNGLNYINGILTEYHIDELYLKNKASFVIIRVYILICLCIMTVSSFSTVQYLHRHMRSVAQSGSSFSTLRSQMRITITGISQGVLYDTFYFIDSFTFLYSTDFQLGTWVSFTAISLYISGTTVSLGISQAAFRQRAADVWRTFKSFCGVGMVTNDVTLHSVDIS